MRTELEAEGSLDFLLQTSAEMRELRNVHFYQPNICPAADKAVAGFFFSSEARVGIRLAAGDMQGALKGSRRWNVVRT